MMKPLQTAALAMSVVALAAMGAALAQPVPGAGGSDPFAEGKAVYKRANCIGCHKWHGNGGGGYGGDALSLRRTALDQEQIVQVVSCGRPATGMPYHLRGAYDEIACYGMHRSEMDGSMPPEGVVFLRPSEIEAVAKYVIGHIKGKGEPDYSDCIDFFGEGSRVCNIYRPDKAADATAPHS